MSSENSQINQEKMLEDAILDENPEVDPSVDSSVPRTNGADAEDGNILELDDLNFGDPSDQASNAGDSVHSSILGESDSQEHEVPANQEIREDDNLDGNPMLEAANVVVETANLAEIDALDIAQQLKQLPAILQEFKNIARQLETKNTSSGSIDDASNFITKKDLEAFATKQDLESLVSKADLVERLPSADKWTDMVDKLAPLASLDGLSVMMGSVLQQLRVFALTQRRLARRQGKSVLLGKKLLTDGMVDRVKFLKTSHKITNVYNSLRSSIARKVTSLEEETEIRDLVNQLDAIKKEQDAFARILEPGDHDDESQVAALDEIVAIETTVGLAQHAQERQDEERKKRKHLESHRASSTRCFFCQENHDSFRCQKYPDLPSKLQLFREKNRCMICGQPGCNGSVAACKAKNRVCKNCDPSLPLEQREHHQTLCPRRRQKKRSSGGRKAIEEKVAPSEALEAEEKFGHNVDRFLDPSAQQLPGRYVILAKHVTQTSDSEDDPAPSKRQKVSTDSNGIGEDPSAKEVEKVPIQKKKKKNAGGKKTKKAKKPIMKKKTESVDSVKKQRAANHENPSESTN